MIRRAPLFPAWELRRYIEPLLALEGWSADEVREMDWAIRRAMTEANRSEYEGWLAWLRDKAREASALGIGARRNGVTLEQMVVEVKR